MGEVRKMEGLEGVESRIFESMEKGFKQRDITSEIQKDAVKGMITRLIGINYLEQIDLEIVESDKAFFELESSSRTHTLTIRGDTGVSLASGFNWFLKYYCNATVTWGDDGTGNQLSLPKQLPLVLTKFRMETPLKYRYYLNVCTHSYSAAWWTWKRWEQEIDWMALNGINLPLSFTGQEYIWDRVYKSFGVTPKELDVHFSGPAFLAWERMGNIRGWGGPLSDHWKTAQAILQLQILERQREFGMTPVLPGFAGHIPEGIGRVFPFSNITRSSDWVSFPEPYCCDYLLQPLDPVFLEIGRRFIIEQTKIYGTDHIYNADTYNEMAPSSRDLDYLQQSSKSVYLGMSMGDPEAIWLMQGWLFQDSSFWGREEIKAYLSGVPNDRMIILDLYSDQNPVWSKTDSYFGKPFIWCMLHNFGGTRGIYGLVDYISTEPIQAYNSPNSSMIGTGLTPEAIEQNPVMYELMAEMGWRTTKFNTDKWLEDYATRRYGGSSSSAKAAWDLMHYSVYNTPWDWNIKSFVCRVPSSKLVLFLKPNATMFVDAWRNLVKAKGELNSITGPYLYDVVDITRQALSNIFYDVYQSFDAAFDDYVTNGKNTTESVTSLSSFMLSIIDDMDEILGSNVNFLLGRWIKSSSEWGNTPAEKANIQFNARNQLTLWGPDGEINDYASKQWSGLVSDYYKARWNLYLSKVTTAVSSGKPFNENEYQQDLLALEKEWDKKQSDYPTEAKGDTLKIAESMLQKYATQKSNFEMRKRYDAPGNNLFRAWTKDIAQLTVICNADPQCQGFNSDGFLKTNVSSVTQSNHLDLYIKKN